MRKCLLAFCFSFLFSFPALAAATPAEADVSSSADADVASPAEAVLDDRPDFYLDDLEDLSRDEVLQYILAEVIAISDSMSGPAADQASASLEDSQVLDSSEEDDVDVDIFTPISVQAASSDDFVNVLRFDVTFRGTDYVLLFPPEYVDSLYIDSNNRLWNMSASTIMGRAVASQFDPYQTEGDLFYLTPCLGNNFSSVRNYGSPNYKRHYYYNSSDRLTYSDSYGEIMVDHYYQPFYVSQTLQYVMIFVLTGGVLIIWLRSWRKY